MAPFEVESIEAGDELYIDGKEATVEWAMGGEFSVVYEDGHSRTITGDEVHRLRKEEDLDEGSCIVKFTPYYGKPLSRACPSVSSRLTDDFEEPMVAIQSTRRTNKRGRETHCLFNKTAIEKANLAQYQHANLLVSERPYVFAVSPVIEGLTHSGSVELNRGKVDISKLAKDLSFHDFYKNDARCDHRWLKAQWDETNEMFIVDVSCLNTELIIDREINRR